VTASAARGAALKVISRVRERGAFAHETLNTVLTESNLSGQDAALATRLAYGTVSCRGTLECAVERYVDAPGRLEPRVRDVLALGAYEILFMRTPVWAAVNEAVELARAVQPRAAGLVNAVLRRMGESRDAFPWGDPESDDAALARLFGHPEWLTSLLVEQLGRPTARAILEADNEPAPLYLAHLPFMGTFAEAMARLDADGAQPSPCDLAGCIVAAAPAQAIAGAALRQGYVIVCDAGAQFAAHVLHPRPGSRVLDVGAGKGSKTLVLQGLAVASGGPARVTAVDKHRFKLDVLTATLRLLRADDVTTLEADATDLVSAGLLSPLSFEAVFLDAPCSGIGTLRRHPDKRWRLAPEDIEILAVLGGRLLREASRLVSPGGFVVYSTCTLTRQENDDVIADFLRSEEGEGFSLEPISQVPRSWEKFLRANGTFQSLPQRGGPDGHFVARLRRAVSIG
jgi:16S rRNA (cytosine967-C5)-methyltransferase